MSFKAWQAGLAPLDLVCQPDALLPLEADKNRLKLLRPAAVLLPLVQRDTEINLLLTRRADHLAQHAGQIALPGGKFETEDISLLQTALRETHEETGIEPSFIKPLGFLPFCKTSSGFCIFPLVATLQPDFVLQPEEGEVAEIFEVPLNFLMSPDNHHKSSVYWKGRNREVYKMPYQAACGREYNIWGVTAQIIRQLYELDYKSPAKYPGSV